MGAILGTAGLMFGATFVLADGFSRTSDRANTAINSLAANVTNASSMMSAGLVKIKAGFKGLAVAAVIAAPLLLGAKAAIEYETAFAGVRKTVEATDAEFNQLSGNIRRMSTQIPIAATNLAHIGEMAGQLGVSGVDNLTVFINTIGKIAVATNLTEDLAATSFARILNIMGRPISEVDRMGAAVVHLGNNFATTEQEIVNFSTRIAGAGRIAGLTTSELFAIGAGFTSVGVQAEVGGTAVQKVLIGINTAVTTGNKQLAIYAAAAGKSIEGYKNMAPAERFLAFIEGLQKQGDNAVAVLDALSLKDQRLIRAFLSMANAGDLLRNAMTGSNIAFAENLALNVEAEKRFATTASQLQITKNQFMDLGIVIGDAILPGIRVFNSLLQKTIGFIRAVASSPLGKFMIIAAGATAVVIGATSALIIALGSLQWAMGRTVMGYNSLTAAATRYAGATNLATGAVGGNAAGLLRFLKVGGRFLGWAGLAVGAGLLINEMINTNIDTTAAMADGYRDFGTAMVDAWADAERAAFSYKWAIDQSTVSMRDFMSVASLNTFDKMQAGLDMIKDTWDGNTFTLTKTLRDELAQLGILQSVLHQGSLALKFRSGSPRLVKDPTGNFVDPSKLHPTAPPPFNLPKFRPPFDTSKVVARPGESLLDALNRSKNINRPTTPANVPTLPRIEDVIREKGGGDVTEANAVSQGDVGGRVRQPVIIQLQLDARTIAEEMVDIELEDNNRN